VLKKIFSIILSIIICISCVVTGMAANIDEISARLKPLNLMDVTLTDAPMTRGEAISALLRLYLRSEVHHSDSESVFSDVQTDSPLAPYSNYAYELGFVNGVGDGRLLPDEYINMQQFVKIAVCVLGWQDAAESAGGYPNGYINIASKLGLLKDIPPIDDVFSYKHAMYIINNMLDCNTLEPVWGTGELRVSEDTLYEQIVSLNELSSIRGIVTAAGTTDLSDLGNTEEGEIRVGETVLKYEDKDAISLLGRNVTVYYRYGDNNPVPVVASVYVNKLNNEFTIPAYDIENLDLTKCVYYDTERKSRKEIKFDAPKVIYNGGNTEGSSIEIPQSGTLTALDYDNDKKYEVIFIDEYESFIVDKVISNSNTVYFESGYTFRGKNGIRFDFDNEDLYYDFYNENMEKIEFSSIKQGDVISVWADLKEEKVRVIVSENTVTGSISEKDEESVKINGENYKIYVPNLSAFLTEYSLGDNGTFALNHEGEIIGVKGEITADTLYGYVLGFEGGRVPEIEIISPAQSEKKVKITAGEEIITYNYDNGEAEIYEFADRINFYDEFENKSKISSRTLSPDQFDRAIIAYELNSEGKIKSLAIFDIPEYERASQETEYLYNLNGKLNSFGGYINKPAFYVGESTQVICIPKKNNPDDEDYKETVTLTDEASYTIVPIRIDSTTQIAESAVIIADMDAGTTRLFADTDAVSIIGKIRNKRNYDDTWSYQMEVLTGDTVETLYVHEDSKFTEIASTLKSGDLIRYEIKSDGEISNLAYLASLDDVDDEYFINHEGQRDESVYALVYNAEFDRLDDFRNERVDKVGVQIGNRVKNYVIPREDGPMIYTYNKQTNMVSPAVPEELIGSSQVGSGASAVYMLVNENNPIVVVNIVE